MHRAGETIVDGRRRVAAPYGDVIRNWSYAARKRTGDTKSGWRPPPDKNFEPVPHWGKKIARRIAPCTWDVKHNGHSDPADLIGGETPGRAFWNAQMHATHVQIHITSESLLFLPLSFYALGKFNLI
jgi:hypothetical protein